MATLLLPLQMRTAQHSASRCRKHALIEALQFRPPRAGNGPAGVRGTHETTRAGSDALICMDGSCAIGSRSGCLPRRLFGGSLDIRPASRLQVSIFWAICSG